MLNYKNIIQHQNGFYLCQIVITLYAIYDYISRTELELVRA